ncbi:MAG: PEP-CTERM sorting domain-containing protein [Acidobacteriia bacterium]|nr:PEP-CTERM sorting domain-containing protein [Terriglobia bacterium]
MNHQVGGNQVRRRRNWYRRRLRAQRGLITAVMLTLLAAVCGRSAVRFFAAAPWRASQSVPESPWTRGNVHANLSALAARASQSAQSTGQKRGVYPYSVVPGGVDGPDGLRRAAAHDAVVWQHYARFQYEHARLLRATQAREVYLSYRLRNRIFWTRKKFRLHLGELLLTDGEITARARCGNQVSETPKLQVSEEEPAEDVLDKPVAELEPPPLPIRSSLLPPSLPGANPASPQGPQLFTGGFVFPYIPFGMPAPPHVCETASQEQHEGSLGVIDNEKEEKPCVPPHRKPPVVPEPSTWILISSGLAAVYWRYRRTRRALSL